MTALVRTAVEEFGSLEVMVNNAGVTTLGPAAEFDVDDWREVIDVDLVGCQAAGRQMIEQKEGGALGVLCYRINGPPVRDLHYTCMVVILFAKTDRDRSEGAYYALKPSNRCSNPVQYAF